MTEDKPDYGGVKRSGLHLRPDTETRVLLKHIDNLTHVQYEDILKLGCQAFISLYNKGMIERENNVVSTNKDQSEFCFREDREPQRDEPANQP